MPRQIGGGGGSSDLEALTQAHKHRAAGSHLKPSSLQDGVISIPFVVEVNRSSVTITHSEKDKRGRWLMTQREQRKARHPLSTTLSPHSG